ncbi:MAG TPA: HAD-IIA family hydrolase [Candidatus Limnocylindria bacterium]|nr:HAD-IIA family hydrolase [Candidatus Limnocylindria bacterium]
MQTDRFPRPRLVIFDLDGVVYRGDHLVAGASQLISRLRDVGVLVRFATNNSMRMPDDFARRLGALGVPASADEIVTSTTATIEHLRRHLPDVHRVLAVGEEGLCAMLRAAGYAVTPAEDAIPPEPDGSPLAVTYDAVVAGLDLGFSFRSLAAAQAALLGGARFVATNNDAWYPTQHGFLPGAGSMVAAIGTASGVEPTVIGKPEPGMFSAILEQLDVAAGDALVVGDNPDADVIAANRAGIRCALVLTGVATASVAAALEGERRPSLVVRDPDDLAARFGTWLS